MRIYNKMKGEKRGITLESIEGFCFYFSWIISMVLISIDYKYLITRIMISLTIMLFIGRIYRFIKGNKEEE